MANKKIAQTKSVKKPRTLARMGRAMKAKKQTAEPANDAPSMIRMVGKKRFDLSDGAAGTVEAFVAAVDAEKRAAQDVLAGDFSEFRHHLDAIDRTLISVLADLVAYPDLVDTTAELATKIAEASFCMRGLLPNQDEEVTP